LNAPPVFIEEEELWCFSLNQDHVICLYFHELEENLRLELLLVDA